MALSNSAIRAIAARRAGLRAANDTVGHDNDNGPSGGTPGMAKRRPSGLLAACIAAGGFDQNARFA